MLSDVKSHCFIIKQISIWRAFSICKFSFKFVFIHNQNIINQNKLVPKCCLDRNPSSQFV